MNLIGVIAGILALVTMVLPWWGADGPLGYSARLTFFTLSGLSDQADQALSQIMVVFAGFVVAVATVGFVGSIYRRNSLLLIGSSMLSFVTPILYAFVLDNAIKTACQSSASSNLTGGSVGGNGFGFGSSSCVINGVIGSANGFNWGFQTGFYLIIVSGILFLVGALFHGFFMLPRTVENAALTTLPKNAENVGKNKYCSECGSLVSTATKFCSNCASPLHFS